MARVSGGEDEAWVAVKRVLSLVEDRGIPLEGIALLARSLDRYLPSLERLLAREGIPWRSGVRRSALSLPVVQAVRRLFDLPATRFHRRLVVECLESRYLDWKKGFEGEPPPARLVDSASRRLGVGWGRHEWERFFSDRKDSKEASRLRAWMGEVERAFGGEGDRGGWRAQAESLVEDLFSFLRLDPLPRGDQETAAFEAVEEIRGSLLALGALDRLGIPAPRKRFLEAAVEAIEATQVSAADPAGGGVQVLNVMQARGMRFRAAILLGLNEGVFPRLAPEDPFLPDRIRKHLRALGHKIEVKGEGLEEERILFALAVSSVADDLTLVYERSDDEGKPAIRSAFVDEVARAIGAGRGEREGEWAWPEGVGVLDLPRMPLAKLTDPRRGVDPMLLSPPEWLLARVESGGDLEGGALDLVPAGRFLPRALEVARRVERRRDPPGPFDGEVGPLDRTWKERRIRGFSASFLESAVACPFQTYLRQVLGLSPLEWPEEEERFPGSLLVGNLTHAFLERFHRGLALEGRRPEALSAGDRAGRMRAALDEVFREARGEHPHHLDFAWTLLRESMEAWLPAVLEADARELAASGFTPLAVEVPARAALEGTADGERFSIPIQGKLDRVEAKGTALRVTDWKYTESASERSSSSLLPLVRLREVQAPAYLLLAPRIEGAPEGAVVAGARLVRIAPNREEGVFSLSRDLPGDFWSTPAGGEVGAAIFRFLKALEGGSFPIRPDDGPFGACARCAVPEACRRRHWPSRNRARLSPFARSLEDLARRKAPETP